MNFPETSIILIYGCLALLLTGILLTGLKIATFFNPKLLISSKKHPYILGFKISGTIGVIVVAALFLTADSLETYIGAWVFSIGIVLASVFAGLIIGGSLKSKGDTQ